MNVVLAGEESAGLQVLRALEKSKHRLVAVLATPVTPGDARVSVWKMACDLGFETWPAELVRDAKLAERLRSERVEIFLNVHSRYIVNNEVLSAPLLGAYNLHPGPLPRYAGLNAVSWAILNGEHKHGVTVHKMEREIDAGPIAYQSFFAIEDDDTALTLSFKCIRLGVPLMLQLLEMASTEPSKIPAIKQDPALRLYFGAGEPEEGQISWACAASKIIALVRACDYFPFHSPFGHARTSVRGQDFAIIKAQLTGLLCDIAPGTIGDSTDSGVYIACRDQWILASKLKVQGKYVAAQNFLKTGDICGA